MIYDFHSKQQNRKTMRMRMRNLLVLSCCFARFLPSEPFMVQTTTIASSSSPFSQRSFVRLHETIFYNDFEDFEKTASKNTTPNKQNKTPTTLKAPPSSSDWRAFRRNLLSSTTFTPEELWAHETSLPEVGGLLVRMPLEYELRLTDPCESDNWYEETQDLINDQLHDLAELSEDGQPIDMNDLKPNQQDFLQMFLRYQETWQEVCVIVDTKTSLVLNRPMALQLTENLAQLVVFGNSKQLYDLKDFLQAFGKECGVYVGGPRGQDQPAMVLHGYPEIPGCTELAPQSGVYQGGDLLYITKKVLDGTYAALDFRFFVGKHCYKHLRQPLSEYQSVACHPQVVLNQCIQLATPLWHQVMELCGGQWSILSRHERLKRDDLKLAISDDDRQPSAQDFEIVIVDEDVTDELGDFFVSDDDDDEEDDDDGEDDYYTI